MGRKPTDVKAQNNLKQAKHNEGGYMFKQHKLTLQGLAGAEQHACNGKTHGTGMLARHDMPAAISHKALSIKANSEQSLLDALSHLASLLITNQVHD